MLKINPELLRQIYDHTEAAYPHECCGVMIGTMETPGDVKTVLAFRKCKNLNTERAHDRYEMDPLDQLRAEQECVNSGLSIVGIYHSHPDHPSRPSQTDLEASAPVYSYVIISVQQGRVASVNSWLLNEREHKFEEEPMVIQGEDTK